MIDKSQKSKNTKIKLKEFYDSSQDYLDRLNKHDEQAFMPYVSLCKKYLSKGSTILDAGCGTGLSSYLLAKAGFKVVGTDISELFLSRGIKKYKGQKGLSFKVCDAAEMPFPNQSFDAVCSYDLLEHVVDVAAVLKEMSRITKKGGLVIISATNHLDPVVHFKNVIKWKRKIFYKPWESKYRLTTFYKAISTFFLVVAKSAGLNKRIYYLEPVLSNDEESCGKDFDATWLINRFDIENILKEFGFSIINTISPHNYEGRIMRIMRMFKLPKALQSFYLKMTVPSIVVAIKK